MVGGPSVNLKAAVPASLTASLKVRLRHAALVSSTLSPPIKPRVLKSSTKVADVSMIESIPRKRKSQPKNAIVALVVVSSTMSLRQKRKVAHASSMMNRPRNTEAVVPASSTLIMTASLPVIKKAALTASFTLSHSAKMALRR